MIPRLHVVTDDEVLAGDRFPETAAALCRALGGDVALHVRGHGTPAGRLHDMVRDLARAIRGTGALLLVADRVDVALAVGDIGVRLGGMSIPVAAARALLPEALIARSVHSLEEASATAKDGADMLVLGTIWETASHPGRPGAGPGLIREVAREVDVPVVAIGGVTPERACEALDAGAAGVAVLRGIWGAEEPLAAAREYLDAMESAAGSPSAAQPRRAP